MDNALVEERPHGSSWSWERKKLEFVEILWKNYKNSSFFIDKFQEFINFHWQITWIHQFLSKFPKIPQKLTKLNKKNPYRVLAQRSLHRQIVREITAIAILHDQVNIVLWLFAVEQHNDVLMMQLCEFFQNFDFLSEKILWLCQALLGDAFYGDGVWWWLNKKRMEKKGESISIKRDGSCLLCRNWSTDYGLFFGKEKISKFNVPWGWKGKKKTAENVHGKRGLNKGKMWKEREARKSIVRSN